MKTTDAVLADYASGIRVVRELIAEMTWLIDRQPDHPDWRNAHAQRATLRRVLRAFGEEP